MSVIVADMRQIVLMIAVVALVALVGCPTNRKPQPETKVVVTPNPKPTNVVPEKLTKLTYLDLGGNQLTDVPKGLEKLTKLEGLNLIGNSDLTKAQIAEFQKALPKCRIRHNAKK